MRILLTGTPGVGKTRIANILAKKLSARVVSITDILKRHKLYSKFDKKNQAYVADLKKLTSVLRKVLNRARNNIIIEGHLGCELKLPVELVIVLRCHPLVLWKRLKKRDYSFNKIVQNVQAEMLDYCTLKAEKNYQNVIEIDSTHDTKHTAEKLLRALKNKKTEKISWLPEALNNKKLIKILSTNHWTEP